VTFDERASPAYASAPPRGGRAKDTPPPTAALAFAFAIALRFSVKESFLAAWEGSRGFFADAKAGGDTGAGGAAALTGGVALELEDGVDELSKEPVEEPDDDLESWLSLRLCGTGDGSGVGRGFASCHLTEWASK